MNSTHTRIQNYLAEYGSTLGEYTKTDGDPWQNVMNVLVRDHDWTEEGAMHIVQLIRNYGGFVLGNAYAISVVLGIQDGELGF
jgi:hypothetical protein